MVTTDLTAFPCSWPVGWPQTPKQKRKSSLYRVSFSKSRDQIMRQLKLLGASSIVVSTNIQLRRDGLPYASAPEPADPSVAVYWSRKGVSRVIACDQWNTVRENMRAVGLALSALRQLERTGATQVVERAFLGLAALPANTTRSWREVFGYPKEWCELLMPETIHARFKRLLLSRHPDTTTGSRELYDELQNAYKEALKEISGNANT